VARGVLIAIVTSLEFVILHSFTMPLDRPMLANGKCRLRAFGLVTARLSGNTQKLREQGFFCFSLPERKKNWMFRHQTMMETRGVAKSFRAICFLRPNHV